MWLAASRTPPVGGMCSPPRQRRLVNTSSNGLTTTTARRYQKPIRLGRTAPPRSQLDRCTRHDASGVRAANSAGRVSGSEHLASTACWTVDVGGGRVSAGPTGTERPGWSIVLPVKRLAAAKSRLDLAAADRSRLAGAMAADTVAAALAAPSVGRVVVVSDDELAADLLTRLGADVVPDA